MNNIGQHRKVFFILTISQIFSKLADRGLLFGFSWYLINQYSQSALTVYLTASTLPHLMMVFLSGKMVNRYSPIAVMRYAELFRSILLGILGVILALHFYHIQLIAIIILTFAANIFAAFFNPALLTVPKQFELSGPQYQKIVALLNSSASVARMVGPLMALPIFSYWGVTGLVWSCFILYLLAWIIELFIKNKIWHIDAIINETKKTYFFNLIKDNHLVIKILLIFFIINLVVIPIQLFMPLYAKNIFFSGINALTAFESSLGCGLLAGSILVIFFSWENNYNISIPYLLAALFYILYALSHILWISAASLFLFGFFLAIGNVITTSFYQQATTKKNGASIMAIVNFVSNASGPMAIAVAGILLTITSSVKNLVVIYSAITFLITLILLFINFREKYDRASNL